MRRKFCLIAPCIDRLDTGTGTTRKLIPDQGPILGPSGGPSLRRKTPCQTTGPTCSLLLAQSRHIGAGAFVRRTPLTQCRPTEFSPPRGRALRYRLYPGAPTCMYICRRVDPPRPCPQDAAVGVLSLIHTCTGRQCRGFQGPGPRRPVPNASALVKVLVLSWCIYTSPC